MENKNQINFTLQPPPRPICAEEEGREEGREEAKLEDAAKLKQLGVAVEIISQATGLSVEAIKKL